MGRVFLPEEDQPGKNLVVVLSHGIWQRRFGGAANILGQSLTLDGQSYKVIGVAPENFRLYQDDELWTPLALTTEQTAQNRTGEYLAMIARLKPAVSFERPRPRWTLSPGKSSRRPATIRATAVGASESSRFIKSSSRGFDPPFSFY